MRDDQDLVEQPAVRGRRAWGRVSESARPLRVRAVRRDLGEGARAAARRGSDAGAWGVASGRAPEPSVRRSPLLPGASSKALHGDAGIEAGACGPTAARGPAPRRLGAGPLRRDELGAVAGDRARRPLQSRKATGAPGSRRCRRCARARARRRLDLGHDVRRGAALIVAEHDLAHRRQREAPRPFRVVADAHAMNLRARRRRRRSSARWRGRPRRARRRCSRSRGA